MKKQYKGTLTEVLEFICKQKRKIFVFKGWKEDDTFFLSYKILKVPDLPQWR